MRVFSGILIRVAVTALPALAVPAEREPALVFRRLIRPTIPREICLITRRGRSLSPAAQGLRDMIVEQIPGTWPGARPLD